MFGNGHDYDWALSGEEDDDAHEAKQDIRLPDVCFSRSQFTDDADCIRTRFSSLQFSRNDG